MLSKNNGYSFPKYSSADAVLRIIIGVLNIIHSKIVLFATPSTISTKITEDINISLYLSLDN